MINPDSRPRGWREYVIAQIARDLAWSVRYFDRLVQWRPLSGDGGQLLSAIGDYTQGRELSLDPDGLDHSAPDDRVAVLINGNLNHTTDIEGILNDVHARLSRHGRVFVVAYNPYLYLVYRALDALGLRESELPSTFMTRTDLANLCRLSGFEIVTSRAAGFFPWRLFGIGTLLNAILPTIPIIRRLGYVELIILRPRVHDDARPSLSIIVPARNERGNIAGLIDRLPEFNTEVEVVFVEGHSTDGTWEEIRRVMESYAGPIAIAAYQQSGEGKADAVRLGFKHARHALLVILDADLSVPPEILPRFHDAYCRGHGDFINGTRLVYPMEDAAMRYLNRLGNVFFAKALSYVLSTRVGDSLCGTKLFPARDYARMTAWRVDFGDFDPFGDFELLFPAAVFGMGIVDVPVRYRAREYGSTNISRFRHGWMLLKMTILGWFRLKISRGC